MDVEIQGYCDEKFTAVKDAFRKNFEDDLEVGASFAATIDGKFVVDIWGGYADAALTRPWEQDTIVNVYSTSKVMTAICAHILIDRGQLDVDAPVTKYWPEFAQAGKDQIPVRYLLSYQWVWPALTNRLRWKTFMNGTVWLNFSKNRSPSGNPANTVAIMQSHSATL